MRQWTLEERYRVLESPEDIKELHERNAASVYRQTYHVQPVTGLSSDPNGFVRHKGLWHLFYQWCPWGAVHGLKYWYHVTSKNLVTWQNAGIGLKPDRDYDNKGTHSGSGISVGDDLYLFYTGNHRDENWVRTPYTCAAYLGEDGRPVKLEAPLFGPRDDHSEHQRDPKVFFVESQNAYFIFIGAQTLDKRGCVLVYKSPELLSGWEFAGELKVPGYEDFGGMWECPSIERIDGKDVLVFSPQYTKLPGRGESTNHNIYFIGEMDYETLTFTPDGPYRYLDYGFDFYAAQIAPPDEDGQTAMIAWIGLPDNHYPTEEEDWEGSMTLPRILSVRDGRLIQRAVPGIEALRERLIMQYHYNEDEPEKSGGGMPGVDILRGRIPASSEILIAPAKGNYDMQLFARADGKGGLKFSYDEASQTITVDKTALDKRFNEAVGEVLTMPLENPLKEMRIFVDHCSVEIFVNDGEATFTTHVYPTEKERYINAIQPEHMVLYSLRASVNDDFVI